MLAVQDSKADANYFADLAGMAKGGLTVQSSTGTMMERVSSGENLLGYNILGSYAEARAKTDPSLGISYPKDYVLVLSRVSFITQESDTRMPPDCGSIMCCRKKGRAFWPTRRIFPLFVTISKAKMISTA
jgi:hypothetical protein